jgi:Uma2 family endonuclease
MTATSPHIRFTVDEYFRMSEAGIFDGRRVELLDGRVVRMHAQNDPHMWCISKTNRALTRRLPEDQYWVILQGTLRLPPYGAPDPDVHVFQCPEGTPAKQRPSVALVIEVSDTTYKKDSGKKLRVYAEAGVSDYWIVNLPLRRVEVYRRPTLERSRWTYLERVDHGTADSIQALALPGLTVAVSEIIP